MTEETEGKETKVAGVEIHPPEGEQERSHESEDTLSPDEKSGDGDLLDQPSLPGPD